MTMKRFLRVLYGGELGPASLMILATLASTGCGYSLAGRGSFLPSYIKSIGVPTFANRTVVLAASQRYPSALIGEVASIAINPASFTPNQLTSRYVITMSARIELRDNHSNTVLWQNPSLVFRQDYEAASGTSGLDPTAFFGQQANALDRVTSEFARTIVSAILEAF